MKKLFFFIFLVLVAGLSAAQQVQTYAEKLGFPKGARVLILHMDDAGMSYGSDHGIERVFDSGVANSTSVMMPCPWVPQMVRYIKSHRGIDAGLHLTLTSEWDNYRWGPLSGRDEVPGLVDEEGCLWHTVAEVVQHATPDEVDKEIRAQLDRAEKMGFHPTHLDSHMGTVFATPAYLEKYVRLGIEKHIPVMLPGGEDSYIKAQLDAPLIAQLKKEGKWKAGMPLPTDTLIRKIQEVGAMIWNAGLPVLDDLHNGSYDWKIPGGMPRDNSHLRAWRTGLYEKTLLQLKPGVTMVIMHCTDPSPVFSQITDSGDIRKADMLVMLNPAFRKFLKDHGFILTTWRELMERRQHLTR